MIKRMIRSICFIGITLCIFIMFKIKQDIKKPIQKVIIVKTNIKPDVVTIEYDTLHLNRGTRYNATVSQCDNTPFKTADGSIIEPSKVKKGTQRWVALSRDLILDQYRYNLFNNKIHWKGYFKFGDTILIESKAHPFINGEWVVHDCMSARAVNSIDFLASVGVIPRLGVAKDVKIIIKK